MNDEEIRLIKGYFNDGYCCNLDELKNIANKMIKENNKLQSNWNSLREVIKECYKRYEDSNIELNDTYKYYLNSPLPPRYTMNLGAIELTDYLLDKMNEIEGKNKEC